MRKTSPSPFHVFMEENHGIPQDSDTPNEMAFASDFEDEDEDEYADDEDEDDEYDSWIEEEDDDDEDDDDSYDPDDDDDETDEYVENMTHLFMRLHDTLDNMASILERLSKKLELIVDNAHMKFQNN